MIVLFTDFGWNGPYVGQMKAVLHKLAPDKPVVDLMHDAPVFNPRSSAYLLSALSSNFPKETVFLCVVDPGVGSCERKPVVVKADGNWFVGPENGLFNVIATRANSLQYWDITWQPENLSNTFHGRDLFAPVAAFLAKGKMYNMAEEHEPGDRILAGWEDDLYEILYIDHYGNCMTGIRASSISKDAIVDVGNLSLGNQSTFSDVPEGEAFWFENSSGLVELAINRMSLSKKLKLAEGNRVSVR
ncbi:MAG: SAM-dependent chlorinase/fluorinase [Gammaproteobacteria bacterium]|nr:SAM-dependent chlorinase/fluorinase [Gammaproteobacteria bacterium]